MRRNLDAMQTKQKRAVKDLGDYASIGLTFGFLTLMQSMGGEKQQCPSFASCECNGQQYHLFSSISLSADNTCVTGVQVAECRRQSCFCCASV